MKTKRLWALLLAALMVLPAAGCATQTSSGAKVDDGSAVVLEWYFPGDSQPDQDKVWAEFNKKVKEKINATVKINMIDRGSYNDKMTMMLASGTAFDICFTSNWANDFIQAASKGAYLPIDALLEKTPALKNSVPAYVWNGAKYDGKIYGVPSYQIMFGQNSVVVPKALAEKYPLIPENPAKAEDFVPFLQAIKEKEPTLYPTQPLSYDLGYETISPTNVGIKKSDSDYKVYAMVETPEYKEFLKLRREWFQKGYFRTDILTVGDDRNDRMALKYGLIASTYKPGGEAEMKTLYKADMLNIPYTEAYVPAAAGQGAIMSISRTSKNPERALKFLELMATDKELYNMFLYGLEGEHYTRISDNVVEKVADTKYNMASQWMFGNQFNAWYQPNQDPTSWQKTDEMNRQAKVSPLSGFVLNVEKIKTEIAQYNAVEKEYKRIEYGTEDPDAIYPQYLEKLKQAGLDKIVEEVQRQVDEWVAANK